MIFWKSKIRNIYCSKILTSCTACFLLSDSSATAATAAKLHILFESVHCKWLSTYCLCREYTKSDGQDKRQNSDKTVGIAQKEIVNISNPRGWSYSNEKFAASFCQQDVRS